MPRTLCLYRDTVGIWQNAPTSVSENLTICQFFTVNGTTCIFSWTSNRWKCMRLCAPKARIVRPPDWQDGAKREIQFRKQEALQTLVKKPKRIGEWSITKFGQLKKCNRQIGEPSTINCLSKRSRCHLDRWNSQLNSRLLQHKIGMILLLRILCKT